jgi:uncharacterized protein HemX
MKNKQLIVGILAVSALVFGFVTCTRHTDQMIVDRAFEKIENPPQQVAEEQAAKQKAAEFARAAKDYYDVAKSRLELNSRQIDEIQQSYESGRTDLKLAFEEEVFELKKRNLALMARIEDAVLIESDFWETTKKKMNKDMDALDRSIAVLKEKGQH